MRGELFDLRDGRHHKSCGLFRLTGLKLLFKRAVFRLAGLFLIQNSILISKTKLRKSRNLKKSPKETFKKEKQYKKGLPHHSARQSLYLFYFVDYFPVSFSGRLFHFAGLIFLDDIVCSAFNNTCCGNKSDNGLLLKLRNAYCSAVAHG